MNKADIVQDVANKLGVGEALVSKAFEEFVATIKMGLSTGDRVVLSGLGILKVVDRKGRKCRNISKGTDIIIGPYKDVKFDMSKEFKSEFRTKEWTK